MRSSASTSTSFISGSLSPSSENLVDLTPNRLDDAAAAPETGGRKRVGDGAVLGRVGAGADTTALERRRLLLLLWKGAMTPIAGLVVRVSTTPADEGDFLEPEEKVVGGGGEGEARSGGEGAFGEAASPLSIDVDVFRPSFTSGSGFEREDVVALDEAAAAAAAAARTGQSSSRRRVLRPWPVWGQLRGSAAGEPREWGAALHG